MKYSFPALDPEAAWPFSIGFIKGLVFKSLLKHAKTIIPDVNKNPNRLREFVEMIMSNKCASR